MVKHNNRLPNPHLHKWWQRFVRVNFNQKIKQAKRRRLRIKKQQKNGVTPIQKLRPLVQCTTQRYNYKTRFGKGFSLAELKAVKLHPLAAKSIGIYVDKRRKNRCEESLQRNVERLRTYLDSLVMIPRVKQKKGKKEKKEKKEQKLKKGFAGIPADATPEVIKEAKKKKKLVSLFKLPKEKIQSVETIDVSKIDKDYKAVKTLRKARKNLHKKRVRANKRNRGRRSGTAAVA